MVVGLDPDSPELSLGHLVGFLGDDLLAVVFTDDLVTKMHDSLPMVLFRFEILVKCDEALQSSRARLGCIFLFPGCY
jgi:hypothetical protein